MLIGVDIVEIDSIAKLLEYTAHLDRIFTAKELELVSGFSEHRKVESLCGRFAAKEATVKALGTGFNGVIDFIDIETLSEDNGRPILVLHNEAEKMASSLGVKELSVSISHSRTLAVAFVIMSI